MENQNYQSEAYSVNMFTAFKKYATFSGRARRKEYWLSYLLQWCLSLSLLIIFLIGGILGLIAGTLGSIVAGILILLWMLAMLGYIIPQLAVTCRRLHDTGKSFWSIFIALIPFAGPITLLVWLCQDSQPGTNIYGENPKGIS